MLILLPTVIDLISSAVILIPVLLLAEHFFQKGAGKGRKALLLLFSLYLCTVFSLTGIPSVGSLTLDLSFNPVPFIDIAGADLLGFLKTFLLNILLFIPLGILLPALWSRCEDFRYTILFGFGLSALIEILQIFTLRLSDVDDLIANTLGAAAGFGIYRLWSRWAGGSGKYAQAGLTGLFGTFALTFAVIFFIAPPIADRVWNIILA